MLLVKFPSRSRPEKLVSTFKLYVEKANTPSLLKFLVTLDSDDSTVTPELVDTLKSMHPAVDVRVGVSGSKIAAVNRDMEHAGDYTTLLLASDDMIPQVQGYDDIIRSNMTPDNDCVLWFNDGFQGTRLNTLCIMGKKYYERFGYIYHPSYKSVYCDNEFTMVAFFLQKQKYFNDIIIRHEHPQTSGAPTDDLYRLNDTFYPVDSANFKKRLANHFID
jgi:hypothetical protein